MNKPTIIYIAENDHGDLSYSSLMKQLIQECQNKRLDVMAFSEFPSESDRITKVKPLYNKTRNQKETTHFLDNNVIAVGNLEKRYSTFDKIWNTYEDNITPSAIFSQNENNIDNPETKALIVAELKIRQQNEEAFKKNPHLRKAGIADSPGKSEGSDAHAFNRLRSAFNQSAIHEEMSQDIINNLKGQEDLIIITTGTAHIPGINQKLLSYFPNSKKFVIGNFKENQVDLESLESIEQGYSNIGKESCAQVGDIINFNFNERSKEARIPKEVLDEIQQSKRQTLKRKYTKENTEKNESVQR